MNSCKYCGQALKFKTQEPDDTRGKFKFHRFACGSIRDSRGAWHQTMFCREAVAVLPSHLRPWRTPSDRD